MERIRSRPLSAAVAALSCAPLVVLALLVPGVALAETQTVELVDNDYVPDELTIAAGDTVRWAWKGDNSHSVTASDRSFDSHPDCSFLESEECGSRGATFSRTFDEPGTVSYFCKVHPDQMRGTIEVEEPAAEPSPSPSPTPLPSTTPSPSPEPSPSPSPSDTGTPEDPDPDRSGEPSPSPSPSPSRDQASPSPSPSPAAPPPPPPDLPAPGEDPDTTYQPPPPRSPEPLPTITATDSPLSSPSVTEDLDLEPFPESSVDPVAGDEVAIPGLEDSGGGDGTMRTILLAVAAVTVLGSVTAFSTLVLFGPPW